jgi:predicted phosphodiesterase
MTRQPPSHDAVEEAPVPPGAERLVALGDPHGALARARTVAGTERDGRTVLCTVGDVVGYGPGSRCAELVTWLAGEGIRSVRGNHEDWMRRDGTLALGESDDPRISEAALAEIDGWSWDLRFRLAGGAVRVTHSLHDGYYDWITGDNVHAFADRVAPDRIICTGHSHRPAIYRLAPEAWQRIPFDFESDERLVLAIEPECRFVVDCGSLGRPEIVGRPREYAWGTYGVVDFTAGTVELRRVR